MKSRLALLLPLTWILTLVGSAQAAFVIEIDTDGADDGPITYNTHFTFGGDTTTASTSSASSAFGLTPADSIFGGDGVVEPDTYVYRYDPTTDSDNQNTTGIALGVDLLGNTVFGSGVTGGGLGAYRVYAAWPATSNVNGGLTNYTVTSGTDVLSVDVDQNVANDPDGDLNDVWVYLGNIQYDGSSGIIMEQQPTSANSFVSMRAAAVMFEPVPEPSALALGVLTVAGLWWARRRR